MPRIPIYESQVSTPNPGPGYMMGVAAQAGEGNALKANALQGFGRGLEMSANILKEKEDQDETLKALNEFSTFKIEQARKIRERQEAAEPGAPGFVDTTLQEYKTDSDALLGKFKNQKAQQVLRQHLTQHSTSLADQAIGFEANARVKQKFEAAQEFIDKEAKTVRADPSKLQESLRLHDQFITEAGLPPAEQARARKIGKDTIAAQAVRGMIDGDPWKAEKQIRSGALDDALSAQNKDQLLNIAKAEQRHRTAEARQAQALRLAETQSVAQNYIAQLAVNPNAPPPPNVRYDNLVATVGQKAADNISAGIDQARMVGEDAGLLRLLNPQDRKEYVQSLKDQVGLKPDGAALAMHRYRSAVDSLEKIEGELKDDPAQFAIKNNPTVAAAAQNFFEAWGNQDATPERKRDLWNDYKTSQDAYQRNQGLASPVPLSKPLAEKLGRSIDQAKTPEDAVNNLKALIDITGTDAPMVLAQVTKNMAPGATFVESMNRNAAVELMTALSMHKDVDKGLDNDQKTLVKSTAVELTEEVRPALKDYPNGPAMMANLNDTVSSYAKYLVWKDGMDPKAAVKKAYDRIWGENFNNYDTFYTRKKDDPNKDMDVAARQVIDRLDPSTLRISSDRHFVTADTDDKNKAMQAASLKSKYTLTTMPDRSGVLVRFGNGQPVMLDLGPGKRSVPWVIPFEQLRKERPQATDTNMGTNIP